MCMRGMHHMLRMTHDAITNKQGAPPWLNERRYARAKQFQKHNVAGSADVAVEPASIQARVCCLYQAALLIARIEPPIAAYCVMCNPRAWVLKM